MSVIVKGMEMPQKCGQCKLFHAEHPMYCTASEGHRTVGAPYGMPRPDWCPLVEVKEPHWIPVTENTLPEKNRVVVVCGEKGTWDYGTYRGHGDNIHFWHWKKNTFKRVYWWMYKEDALPEPYNGVTE